MTTTPSDFPRSIACVLQLRCPLCDGAIDAGGLCEPCELEWGLEEIGDRVHLRAQPRALTHDEIRKLYDRETA